MESSISPASDFFAVVPDDGNDLPQHIRALSVSVGGAVKVNKRDGSTTTITLPAGTFPAINIARIWATGTTATGLVGLV